MDTLRGLTWVLLAFMVLSTNADEEDVEARVFDRNVMSAKVVSCTGLQLNRHPEVKKFINRDLPLFHNVKFEAKPGSSPYLFLLNAADEVVERVSLNDLSQDECNALLLAFGFFKKEHTDAEIHPEYETGPYFPRERDASQKREKVEL